MARIEGKCREIVEKAEWVAVATAGAAGPHLAGTWGDYVRELGLGDGSEILVPMGGFEVSEQNILVDGRVELLWATKAVDGADGPGNGCKVSGKGTVISKGARFEQAKIKFPWIRAMLAVKVEMVYEQL